MLTLFHFSSPYNESKRACDWQQKRDYQDVFIFNNLCHIKYILDMI